MKIYPPNLKVKDATFFKLSDEEYLLLNEEIVELEQQIKQKNDTALKNIEKNSSLAGHIKHQYSLSEACTKNIEKILAPVVAELINRQNNTILLSTENIVLCNSKEKNSSCWVNFQKKYEFNPVHHHTGYLSFVIWMKIPYLMENENKYENIERNRNIEERINGDFQFIVKADDDVRAVALRVDNRWEKRGVIFPSNLSHVVYPFYTSDEYRISISGNFWIK